MNIWTFIPQWFIDSSVYYHLYYKHTTKHKKDMDDIHDSVIAVRKRILEK